MEARKILIANSKTQQRYELQSAATTLGELKAEMREQNIDYSGMSFTEGFSKTQLLGDDSLLPTNVMHRGQVTNDLVILLTNTTKKIASGAEDRSRSEAYDLINSLGDDVKDEIKERFGKNYTQVTTANLWSYLDELDEDIEDEDEEYDEEDEAEENTTDEQMIASVNDTLKEALTSLAEINTELSAIYNTVQTCVVQLTTISPQTYQIGGAEISDDEINNMLASV